jgi:hypothetical protein
MLAQPPGAARAGMPSPDAQVLDCSRLATKLMADFQSVWSILKHIACEIT